MLRERLAQIATRLGPLGLLILAGVFLLTYGILGLAYMNATSQQESMRESIQSLSRIASGSESRVEEVEAEFQAVQQSLPSAKLNELDVFRAMINLVSEVGLNLGDVEIAMKSITDRAKVGNAEYRVLSFSMSVSGDDDDVWDFVQMLDRGETPYRTLLLEDVRWNLGTTSTAKVSFSIYTRTAS